jgi:hypothetical protein
VVDVCEELVKFTLLTGEGQNASSTGVPRARNAGPSA